MDKGYYRQVPYRFFTNEANTDSCKLERLTNLFPDMKETIELELFKSNSLSRTVDRLSRVYTVLTALDTRDDTLHLFLGPYHLSLGPALFAALHFKNASAALLVASRPTAGTSSGGENQRRKRRRENVLRRFRRAVRKLTLVKSIVDQLRPASVLTPYNQYELQQQGIYDLVLAGRAQNADSVFANGDFLEQLAKFETVSSTGERSPLLASNYVKINNLLNLLSTPSQQQQQQQQQNSHFQQQHYSQTYESNPTTATDKIMRMKSSESLVNTINHSNDHNNNNNSGNNPGNILDSESCCCSQHRPTSPFIMFPVNQTASPQPSQLLSTKPRSRANSNSNLLRTPAVLSRQSTANSLPDSASGDISTSDLPSSTSLLTSPQSNPADIDLNTPTNLTVEHPFLSSTTYLSPPATNDEDDLINRISSLLASHLLSRQSTTTTTTLNTAHEHETNSNLSDSAISLSTTGTTGAINSSVTSNQLSSAIGTNDFDKLFQRIKTAVDNRLSIETNSNNRMRPLSNTIATNNENNHNNNHDLRCNLMRSGTMNRRQQLLALHAVSCQEAHTDEYDAEHSTSNNQKHKLDRLSKSQSFDATTLNNRDETTTLLDNSEKIYSMTTLQTNEKGVQTDPRIRHARSKLLETLQAYITSVVRFREHLYKQYTNSNAYYDQHYNNMPDLQQYEYRDLINVRKEILNRFEWVINELEQTIESLQTRRVSVADAQQRIDRPLVKEVIESSLNADIPPVHEHQLKPNDRQRAMPSEDEWRMYARDLQDTKDDLYYIDSLVQRGISKIDRLVTFTNLYT